MRVLFCGSWPFDSSDDSSGHKTIHSTSAISPRDSFSCLSMIICRKHLIISILHIIIRMLFWVRIGILELRIKVLAKFADQLTQSCPNFGSLGIGTRLGSGWVRRQRRISEFLILVTFKETFTRMLFVWISGSDRANKKICRFIRQSRRFVNSSY